MAEVTGTIGQEEVNLENAATEATLKQLLKAMQQGGGGGGSGGGANKSKEGLLDLAKQSGKTAKELEELEDSANNAGNALSRGFGHVMNAGKGLTTELISGGKGLSDFTQHVTGALSAIPILGPIMGSTLQLLTSELDNQIDSYRDLSAAGIDFAGGLDEARRQQTQTLMTFDAYNDLIISNSHELAMLGGTAGRGAKMFTQLSKSLGSQREQFTNLGMTMEDVGEYTLSYMKVQRRANRLSGMSQKEQTAGATAYIKELDRLSKITGKSRKEIEQSMEAASLDKRLGLIMQGMSDAGAQGIRNTTAFFDSVDTDLGESVKKLITNNGAVVNDEAMAGLIEANANLGKAARDLKNGVKGAEDAFVLEMSIAQRNLKARDKTQKEHEAILVGQGNEYVSHRALLTTQGDYLEMYNKGSAEHNKIMNDENLKKEKAALGFSATIQKVRNDIYNTLVESGIFKTLGTLMGNMATSFKAFMDGGGTEKLKTFATLVASRLEGLFKAFQQGKLMETISQYLKDGLSKLGEMMKPHISSALSGLKQMALDAIFGKKETKQEGPPGGGGNGADMAADNGFTALGDILKLIGGATIGAGLAGLGAMLAAGGVVYLGFKAFTTILKMFASGPVAIGAAVFTGMLIGTGAAITLAGKGIDLAGDGVEKIAAGVEKMANMKGAANFAEISTSLGLLGPALISLTAGGVLDSITSFFGADSPFDKIVEGLNKFKGIDATAIDNVKLSGTALEGLSKFGDDLDASGLKEYAKQMERLGDALGKINDELTKDNSWLPFYKGDNAGNTKLPGGSGSGSGTGGEELNTTMLEVRDAIRYGNIVNKQGFRSLSKEV